MKIKNNFYLMNKIPVSNWKTKANSIYKGNMVQNNIYFKSRYDDSTDVTLGDIVDEQQERLVRINSNPTMKYSKDEIKIAKEMLPDTDTKKRLKQNAKRKYDELAENELKSFGIVGRLVFDVLSIGVSEVVNLINIANDKDAAKQWAKKMELIRVDLLHAQALEAGMELSKSSRKSQIKLEYISQINEVQEKELYPKLLDKLQAQREGMKVDIPNCVMVSHNDERVNEELVRRIMSCAYANVSEIDAFDDADILDILESAEEKYQKTGYWNIIYVRDMDRLIHPQMVDENCIASMKAMMCCAGEDYHTTLVFSTTTLDELDDTAIETNRVDKINTDNIKTPKQVQREEIRARLEDENYIKTTPLSAINDLADYTGLVQKYRVDFHSSELELKKTADKILERLPKSEVEKYQHILEKAKENAWYCIDERTGARTIKLDEQQYSTKTEPIKSKGLANVIGMDSLKEDLFDEIIRPLENPQLYAEYGIEGTINGFLLYGPPGCGKTYIIKNLAEELGRYYVEITPGNVGNSFIHQTAKNIKAKFEEAKSHAPSIIFIDEIESIAPSRDGLGEGGAANDVNEQVTELLQQMNNCKDSGVLIVCASNEPQRIDRAIKRTGRLDKKIFVSTPEKKTREALIEAQLKKIKRKDSINISRIAENTEYYTAKDIEQVFRSAAIIAMKSNTNLTTDIILDAIKRYAPDLTEDIVEEYRAKGDM